MPPLHQEYMLISELLIELQDHKKKLKNPLSQFLLGGNTFQISNYHRYPLKLGRILFLCHYIHDCERHSI